MRRQTALRTAWGVTNAHFPDHITRIRACISADRQLQEEERERERLGRSVAIKTTNYGNFPRELVQ